MVLPELSVIEDVARNEGKYQRIILNYPYSFPANHTLRPNIMLEFTHSHIRLGIEELQVRTLIEETLSTTNLFIPPPTKCVSVDETAIEKWVELTRRIMAIERNHEMDDKTLVRHVYDLNAISQANKIHANFIELAKIIVNGDAKQFQNQHIEYAADPAAEIKQSLELLKTKPMWKQRYEDFIETMVYDDSNALPYNEAINTLEKISIPVLNNL